MSLEQAGNKAVSIPGSPRGDEPEGDGSEDGVEEEEGNGKVPVRVF